MEGLTRKSGNAFYIRGAQYATSDPVTRPTSRIATSFKESDIFDEFAITRNLAASANTQTPFRIPTVPDPFRGANYLLDPARMGSAQPPQTPSNHLHSWSSPASITIHVRASYRSDKLQRIIVCRAPYFTGRRENSSHSGRQRRRTSGGTQRKFLLMFRATDL